MTQSQMVQRMIAYILASMLTAFLGGIGTVDFGDQRGIATFIGGIILNGVLVWRAFIDKSPAEALPSGTVVSKTEKTVVQVPPSDP